jgi:putative transposase
MKRSEFSEEQIVYAIRQAESGTPVGDLCRQFGVSEATFYAWTKQYAHLGASELRRLRQVEEENARLKRLVAEPCEKKSEARTPSRTGHLVSRDVSGQLPAGLSLGAGWPSLVGSRINDDSIVSRIERVEPRISRRSGCAFGVSLIPGLG